MRENTFVHKVTKIPLDILIVLGAVCTAASYFIARYLQQLTNDDPFVSDNASSLRKIAVASFCSLSSQYTASSAQYMSNTFFSEQHFPTE